MRRVLSLLSVLLLAQPLCAQRITNTFELSAMLYSFDYREVWPPPLKSEESGFIPGVAFAYMYRGYGLPLYARWQFEYAQTPTTYDGAIIHGDGTYTPFSDRTRNTLLRVEIQGGYVFRIGRQVSIAPYVGYGYRYWQRLLPGDSGYEENYSWSYIPIGARGNAELGRGWSVGLDAVVRIMFGGALVVKILDHPTLTLGNKLGYKLSLPTAVRLSPRWALGVEPWLEFSGIQESDRHYYDQENGQYVVEPESSTNILGAHVWVQYGF